MNKTTELMKWLESNAERFAEEHYTVDEIRDLAIACGFNRITVAQWQTQQRFKEAM